MHPRFAFFAAALLLAGAILPGTAFAQQRQTPSSRTELQLSFAPVAAKVTPAVVNIFASRALVQRRGGVFDDPFFRQFFGDRRPGAERVQRSLGSGVIVSPDGIVVTNNHVVADMTEMRVTLSDRREFEAELVLKDERSDLAVLKLKANGAKFPILELADSDALLVGDLVLAIGNPFGVGQTVTSGIVSAVARSQEGVSDYQSFIQTDAAINPGNSGGALVDLNGRVVGINTAIFSRSGGSIGIGFAVPANMVKVVLASAEAGSSVVRRPYIGARMQSITQDLTESLRLDKPSGVLVAEVFKGSPAERSGLQSGDVVLTVDGQPVDTIETFAYRLATRTLGSTVALGTLRDGAEGQAKLSLEAAPELPPRDEVSLTGRSPLAGALIGNLSPALSEELSLAEQAEGVAVIDVGSRTMAEDVGFRRGDIIIAVNDERVKTSRELARLLGQRPRYWQIVIKRGENVLTTVRPG